MENLEPITVEVTVNAPIATVWAAWNTPEDIMKWCAASADWHAPYAENDLKEGGKFKTTMAAKDGSFSFDFGGEYTEVKENSKIAYAMEDGRKVSVTFEPSGNTVKIIETFDPENTNPREMQQGGWQAILDNFKTYAEQKG